ncbi:MAG: FAD-dependent oxidoreductase, partial [Longimicrobiales bacterium]
AASFDRYPDFASRIRDATGIDVEWRECGKLHVALTAAESAELDVLEAAGGRYNVQRLDADEARSLEPALSPHVLTALLVHRDGRVDSRRLGHAVWLAAERAGVTFHSGRSVKSIDPSSPAGGHTVRLDDHTSLVAGAVVIAAGAWSGTIEGAGAPPVVPVRGQMFAVSAPLVRRTIHAHGCYLIARDDGRTLVGATVEDVGFAPGPTPGGIRQLLDAAIQVTPEIAAQPLIETWAGYRPGTPDGLPILGEDPDMPGLFWATGHFRNGILLAPITGERIGAALAGDSIPDLEAFSIRRFRTG